MAKQAVILVHGMGTHPNGNITRDFKKALTDRAASFGVTDPGFINNVDYKEFNYSDYFDTIRLQFAQNAQARQKGFKYLVGKGFEEKLLTQLTSFEAKFGKDEFFYTHWLDVILYSTMYFGEKIRIDFIRELEKLRKKYNHKNMHIVCHSLGTALVHDALAKYYREDSDPFDNIPDLKTGNFNMASLWTFANVSRMVNLLNGLENPNSSTVVTGNNGCTNNFINVRHKYDPFTWYKTYDRRMNDKLTLTNSVIRKVNTHDFYEYVTEPNVSRSLLGFLYDVDVTDSQFNDGVAEYKKDSLNDKVKTLKAKIDAARATAADDTIKKAIEKFNSIQKKIDALRKSLENIG